MKQHKRILISALITLLVIVVTLATVFTLKAVVDQNDKKNTTSMQHQNDPEEQARTLESQATAALQANKNDEAKALFQQAQEAYKHSGNIDKANSIDAQLALIEIKGKTGTPQPVTPPLTATGN